MNALHARLLNGGVPVEIPGDLDMLWEPHGDDTCAELLEAALEEAEWQFFGPDVLPHEDADVMSLEAERWMDFILSWPAESYDASHHYVMAGKRKGRKALVRVDKQRLAWADSVSWHVNNGAGRQTYARRTQRTPEGCVSQYLHVEVMRQRLLDNPAFMAASLKQFGLKARKCPFANAALLLNKCEVHHRDHDPLNCCESNLELVTPRHNTLQRRCKAGASGYVGVAAVKVPGKPEHFVARITLLPKVRTHKAVQAAWWVDMSAQPMGTAVPRSSSYTVEGKYAAPDMAALARALCLLALPQTGMPRTFTPTAAEAFIWHAAHALAAGALTHPDFGAVAEFPLPLQRYVAIAQTQYRAGKCVHVLPRT